MITLETLRRRLEQLELRIGSVRFGSPKNPEFERYMLDRETNRVYRIFVKNGTLTVEEAR